jgi:hypothetical protein
MDNARVANRRIIGDARGEAANENEDRAWRQWLTFCESSGIGDDPFTLLYPHKNNNSSLSPSSASIELLCGMHQVNLKESVSHQCQQHCA